MADYLCFKHRFTGEMERLIDVRKRSDREQERIARGMLINIGPDWFVDELTETEAAALTR